MKIKDTIKQLDSEWRKWAERYDLQGVACAKCGHRHDHRDCRRCDCRADQFVAKVTEGQSS